MTGVEHVVLMSGMVSSSETLERPTARESKTSVTSVGVPIIAR